MFDDGPFNPIDSSDNGEIGTVTVVSPIRKDVDTTCGGLVNLVQSMTDLQDETIGDIYMFLEAIDDGNVSLPTEMQSLWDTIPDVEDMLPPDYLQHELGFAEAPPETQTDEVPVEDIPPDPAELEDVDAIKSNRRSHLLKYMVALNILPVPACHLLSGRVFLPRRNLSGIPHSRCRVHCRRFSGDTNQ
jgi:hypothetical protein